MTAPLCPRCEAPLGAMDTAAGPTVDFCSQCGGTWYDADEVESLLGLPVKLDLLNEGEDRQDSGLCPACGGRLTELTWPPGSELRVDACSGCGGVWLDRNELGPLKKLAGAQPAPRGFTRVNTAQTEVDIPLRHIAPQGLSWSWVVGGSLLMLAVLATIAGLAGVFGALDQVADLGSDTERVRFSGIASLAGFPIGGFLIGWQSRGFTIIEPALAAIPAGAVFVLLFAPHLGWAWLAPLLVVGVVLALLGAVIGERVQSD